MIEKLHIIIHQNAPSCKEGGVGLPITFWTDLGYKELPSAKMTEGSIFTEHNRSINWNLTLIAVSQYFSSCE